jgi:hypothetical protein
MIWTLTRRHLCLLAGLGLAGVNFSVAAADLSAQERLQAIRAAMVDAAMKSNTRVSATSWMESDGQLRELNRFSSEIKLRDLQVDHFVRDAGEQPTSAITAAQVDMVKPDRCDAPQAKAPLRQVMTVGMDLAPSLAPVQRYSAQQVGFAARTRLMQAGARAERWRLINTQAQTRTYDRLIHGHGEEHVQWHAQLTVTPVPLAGASDDYAAFGLTLQVSGPGQRQAWFNAQEVVLPSSQPALAYGTQKLDDEIQAAIARAVTRMAAQLDKQLACEPQTFVVDQTEGHLAIQAGSHAGLRVGDQLMIANPSVLPRHTLEPDALDAAVLAEVKSVTLYQAEIKQVAGRKQKFNGAWVAWPYTY